MKQAAAAPVSRRKLLGGLVLAAMAAGAKAAPVLRLGGGKERQPVYALAHADAAAWTAQIGSEFRIRSERGVQTLTLAEVRPLGPLAGRSGRARAFALAFTAKGPLPAGNRIYPVSHSVHGGLDIFFGPSGDRLVAIFA
ncbi:MAG: hypothetical protein QOG84_881 [Sphingomonadales bacterium]|jgi:hypothetical protein|nr:hypothetical protein [Sphingomonadales bacterium]